MSKFVRRVCFVTGDYAHFLFVVDGLFEGFNFPPASSLWQIRIVYSSLRFRSQPACTLSKPCQVMDSMPDLIPNVLAERYATAPMRAIWSGEGKVRLERELWIAVMKAQRDLGIPIPDGVIEDYER